MALPEDERPKTVAVASVDDPFAKGTGHRVTTRASGARGRLP